MYMKFFLILLTLISHAPTYTFTDFARKILKQKKSEQNFGEIRGIVLSCDRYTIDMSKQITVDPSDYIISLDNKPNSLQIHLPKEICNEQCITKFAYRDGKLIIKIETDKPIRMKLVNAQEMMDLHFGCHKKMQEFL